MERRRVRLAWALVLVLVVAMAAGGAAGASPGVAVGARPAATSWVVTSTADSGAGTLREALERAGSGDAITFDPAVFPPDSPATISPTDRLPTITQANLTIDASDAGVVLDGSAAGGEATPGLDIRADGVTVRGLQVARFPGCGVEVRGQYITIGGDRQEGAGPFGQGNLISGNGVCGLGMWGVTTSHNTIQGNLIGVDGTGLQAWGNAGDGIHINGANHNTIVGNVIGGNAAGIQLCCNTDSSHNVIRDNLIGLGLDGQQPVPNAMFGVWFHDGAGHNTVGPGNVIAHSGFGVAVDTAASTGNTITQNSIHSNPDGGIHLSDGGNGGLAAPSIMAFNLAEGTAWGRACAGCRVEVFSDAGDQGAVYEGQATADAAGLFLFNKGAALPGPHLTATATDAAGNTSAFSAPTDGSGVEWIIQSGNHRPISTLTHKRSSELADNRIGGSSASPREFDSSLADYLELELFEPGFKHTHITLNEGEEPIDWSRSEFGISERDDEWITLLVQNGVSVAYVLSFWDKANHPAGWPPIESRFTTEEEVERYLEYVRFVVGHFKGRVATYDLWNEPDNLGSRIQYIAPEDYVELVRRTAPVIREVDPSARVMVGSVSGLDNPFAQQYLQALIASDVMPLVDVVAWHPMYGTSPDDAEDCDYYYAYPQLARDIQATARAHGFQGTFRGDEIYWCSPDNVSSCPPGFPMHTNVTAAKYLGRGIVTHLGLDIQVSSCTAHNRRESTAMLCNLPTQFAGVTTAPLPVEVQTTVTRVVTYTFALPSGGHMVALWNDGVAAEEDPGVDTVLTLPGLAGHVAVGLDPLHSLAQPLVTEDDGQALVIRGLRVKDYPLLVRVTPRRTLYLPTARR